MKNEVILSEILTNNSERLDFVRKALKVCPESKLYGQAKNGSMYFIQSIVKERNIT